MVCHSLFHGIFPTQGSNSGLPHCRQVLNPLRDQFSLVAQSCPTLGNPMDCSMPGLPVHHHSWSLPKLMSWVGDAIQPSHPLSSPSPLALNLSQHQGLSNESALHIRCHFLRLHPSTAFPTLLLTMMGRELGGEGGYVQAGAASRRKSQR